MLSGGAATDKDAVKLAGDCKDKGRWAADIKEELLLTPAS